MNEYLNLIGLFLFAGLVAGGFVTLSHYLGKKKKTPEKGLPYECGIDPVGDPRRKFAVKFCVVAMIFIIFDIEVVFLYPWAVLFKEFVAAGLGSFVFIEMMVFLGILAVGLAYVFGRKAIEWES